METVKTNSQEGKKRIEWLDVLKCLAMYIVLCGHVTKNKTPDSLRYYIYAFHMPLFFILSGMGIYLQTLYRDYKFIDFIKGKIRTLLWPYLCFNIFLIPLWIFNFKILTQKQERVRELLLAIFYSNQRWNSLPTSTTWFIPTLFLTILCFFIILLITKKDVEKIAVWGMIFGIMGYSMSLNTNDKLSYPWHLDTVPIAVMLMMFGYIFMKHHQKIDHIILEGSKIKQGLAFILCIYLGYWCAFHNVKVSMGVNSYGSFLLFIGGVVFFSFACYILSRNIPDIYIFRLIGRNTIVYLAIHEQIFRTFFYYSDYSNNLITNHPYVIATFVFILLIPIAYIVERYFPILIGRRFRKF